MQKQRMLPLIHLLRRYCHSEFRPPCIATNQLMLQKRQDQLQARVCELEAQNQAYIKAATQQESANAQLSGPAANMIDSEAIEILHLEVQTLKNQLAESASKPASGASGVKKASHSRGLKSRSALKEVNFASPQSEKKGVSPANAPPAASAAQAQCETRAEKRARGSNRVVESPQAVSKPKRRSPQPALSLKDTLDADEGAAECAQQ